MRRRRVNGISASETPHQNTISSIGGGGGGWGWVLVERRGSVPGGGVGGVGEDGVGEDGVGEV